jgi:hypothetical protein
MRRQRRSLRSLIATGLVLVAAAVALIVPAASESTTSQGLFAYVVPTNLGPLPPCSGSDCTPANTVWHFIYVINANRLTNLNGGTNRATVPNSFVVSSVDEQVFVDGVEHPEFATTYTPPPNASFTSYSGHWPSTVTCPPGGAPCNVVGSPAILPGENTVALYVGWVHGAGEPVGTYVFKFTIHGTVNGTAVVLTANSPPIQMSA